MEKLNTSNTPTVKAKQRWRHRGHGSEVRVMAVVEGYVMVRHKGCVPFLVHWKDFELNYRMEG